MKKDKRLFWIVGCIFALILVAGWFIWSSRFSSDQVLVETEPAGPGTVVIDNTDELSDILLSEEYTATINQLVLYIQTKVGQDVTHAVVEGQPEVRDSGLVVFSIKTEGPETKFSVEVDRFTERGRIIFSVPSSGFSERLQVY